MPELNRITVDPAVYRTGRDKRWNQARVFTVRHRYQLRGSALEEDVLHGYAAARYCGVSIMAIRRLVAIGALSLLLAGGAEGSAAAREGHQHTAPAGVRGCALAVALHAGRHSLRCVPGAPVTFHDGERQVEPFGVLAGLGDGRLSASEWQATCEAFGIAEVDLGRASGDGA